MIVSCILLLMSLAYLICYAVHCFYARRVSPGVGALTLALLPAGCAAIFVFILTSSFR